MSERTINGVRLPELVAIYVFSIFLTWTGVMAATADLLNRASRPASDLGGWGHIALKSLDWHTVVFSIGIFIMGGAAVALLRLLFKEMGATKSKALWFAAIILCLVSSYVFR